MLRRFLMIMGVLVGMVLSTVALSQTVIPGGNVSGTWEASGSPYLIMGEITIHSDSTLNINPGVEVNFQGYYKFIVNGFLEAIGTESDSILFTAADTTEGWHSIRFIDAPDSSHLSYCIIQHGKATGQPWDNWGGGIYCYNSNPTISGNTISENTADDAGGGIACHYCNPIISDNIISGNSVSIWHGGGIYCVHSNPTISGNTISGNYSHGRGGGICCTDNSDPSIIYNTIDENTSGSWGGGIYLENNSNPTIVSNKINGNTANLGGGVHLYSTPDSFTLNEISGNSSGGYGGGIYLRDSTPTLNKNTVVFNTAYSGGGLCCNGSSPLLINCILWENSPEQIVEISGSAQVNYSDIGQSWPGIGNINANPLFVDPPNGNFHLQAGSPCIDAGDPNPIYNDPDSTRADMGCYYYEGPPVAFPNIEVSTGQLSFGSIAVGNQEDLALTIYNIGDTTLVLYNIYSSNPAFTTDFNPADSLITPDDSLIITVAFSPQEITFYDADLTIENNDELVVVVLLGEGIGPVDIILTPEDSVIVIPESGGTFDFNLELTNLTAQVQHFDLWCEIDLPWLGTVEVLNMPNRTLPGGMSRDRNFTQDIPSIAPAGTYTFFGYVGSYPWVIENYDSFGFEKEGSEGVGSLGLPSDWPCTGEGFEEWIAEPASTVPTEFALYGAYPNPFNLATTISFGLPEALHVSLAIYDISGRLVTELIDGWREAGTHEVTFDGTGLASGIYFMYMKTKHYERTHKMLLLK